LLAPYEAVGDLLMELDRPGEALEAYEASDAIWPERYNTLIGAARAAREAERRNYAVMKMFFPRRHGQSHSAYHNNFRLRKPAHLPESRLFIPKLKNFKQVLVLVFTL